MVLIRALFLIGGKNSKIQTYERHWLSSNSLTTTQPEIMFKVNNRNTRIRRETCPKLTIKTSQRHQYFPLCYSISIINFELVDADWELLVIDSVSHVFLILFSGGVVPKDGVTMLQEPILYNPVLIGILWSLVVIGLCIAFAFLAINIRYSGTK